MTLFAMVTMFNVNFALLLFHVVNLDCYTEDEIAEMRAGNMFKPVQSM